MYSKPKVSKEFKKYPEDKEIEHLQDHHGKILNDPISMVEITEAMSHMIKANHQDQMVFL